MTNAADPPSSTASPAPATTSGSGEARPDPAAHLACAYSPRWLSGPTPEFEGLVATYTPHGGAGHEPEPATTRPT